MDVLAARAAEASIRSSAIVYQTYVHKWTYSWAALLEDRAGVAKRTDPQAFIGRVTLRIAELRRERGLTQTELGELLGTNLRNVQRIEAGQNLTLHTLARIAQALGTEPEELVWSSRETKTRRRT
jgi:DNA-binding Xre family transcriptional regulator